MNMKINITNDSKFLNPRWELKLILICIFNSLNLIGHLANKYNSFAGSKYGDTKHNKTLQKSV